jgi:glycosyltransferase involved in cell wall biosynthesis
MTVEDGEQDSEHCGADARDTPLVSIVVTTYNHARFLAEAVESALAQTVRSIEVIVVDDGSTDDPAAVLAKFPQARLITQPNQGLASARNTGWRAAHGQYLVFLDADDRLLPDAVTINLARFARHRDCAFVYGGYEMVDLNGRLLEKPMPVGTGDDAYAAFLERNCVGMHGAVMYRRDCLEKADGFNRAFRACEDYDLYLRLAREHPVAWGPETISQYRLHVDNMSSNIPLMLTAALAVLRGHQATAATNRRWRAAYQRGLREWKEIYARRQLALARDAARQNGLYALPLAALAGVFRLAPLTVCRTAAVELGRRVRGRLQRRLPSAIELGDLRRTTPVSPTFGYDRGVPVDRRYIEAFLVMHAGDIRGRVLEIGDNSYTVRFGGARVTRSDVLHVAAGNPRATLIGDLAAGDHLPSDAFDCIVLTQTLHLVFDVARATATLYRLLKPGGVLLITVPGVSSVDRGEWRDSWYWSFTPTSLGRVLAESFPGAGLSVASYGNVLTAVAFLHGLAADELTGAEFSVVDPHYPVIVAARAVKEPQPFRERIADA